MLCPAYVLNGNAFIAPVGSLQLAQAAHTGFSVAAHWARAAHTQLTFIEVPSLNAELYSTNLNILSRLRPGMLSPLESRAALCTTFVYKPNTYQVLPVRPQCAPLICFRAGIIPLVLNRDIGGPIGKSVSDVAKVFTALTDFSMFPNGVDPRSVVLLLKCFPAGA